MNLFKTLQVPEAQRYWIRQARIPICFLPGGPKTPVDRDGTTLIDLLVDNGRIAAIEPAGVAASAQIFVAVMGASNFTYAEASWTQALADWIGAHTRAFAALGGVPKLLVPDELPQ